MMIFVIAACHFLAMLGAAYMVRSRTAYNVAAVVNCLVAVLHGQVTFLLPDLIAIWFGYGFGRDLILESRLERLKLR